jgi:hypothetical protein
MTTIKRTKERQYNDHNKKDEGQKIQWSVLRPVYCGHCIVCPSSFLLRSLYCLSFALIIVVIVLSVLRPFYCGQGIVCPSSCLLWSWYCLSFVLFIVVMVLSVLRPFYCGLGIVFLSSFYCGHCIVCPYNDQKKKDR